ncbi:MAG: beta-ketoacyl-ACP synthase II [Herpetosiphonaceae bacterium]|nr:beta-ketoacyl-ACP synthase II [Herpetosiphonaceae bacterium]
MQEQRIVITGVGAITPLGLDVPTLWEGIKHCRSGVGRITRFDTTGFDAQIAAEVQGFDPLSVQDRKEARRTDRVIQYALGAADEALRNSEFTINASNAQRVGVLIGSGFGGVETLSNGFDALRRGPGRVSPFMIPMMIPDMPAGMVSIRTGAKGPNFATVSACATGGHAIGEAASIIRRGDADVMIAGGAEASITPIAIAAFASAKTLSTNNDDPLHASRPFDATRDGFVMGEGAGILILERLDHALERGAPILGELVGYGATGDAHHITMPDEIGSGAAQAMRLAIKQAGVQPQDIDYVNAHGTSTPANDRLETLAIKQVFGEHVTKMPVSSSKSQFGHLLGAAGAVEAIISLLAIREGLVPATINHCVPDPACQLDVVPNEPRHAELKLVASNSFGFGGHNVCLVFQKHNEA